MTFGYLAGIAVLLGLFWLFLGLWKIGAVSRGKPIGKRNKEALLLIDLQSVFWDHGPYSEAERLSAEAAILQEIGAAKTRGHGIVAIRQEWSIPSTKVIAWLAMQGRAIAGSDGTELAAPFAERADHVLIKRVQDAFETGELDQLLANAGVGKLRLVGLDLNHCVQKTALAARRRGFEVTVIRQATLAAAPTAAAEKRMAAHGVVLA